jgi:2-polyprenyl-6-methoxyphenol hydroxylase-like FAD-dependent oxidoreductase
MRRIHKPPQALLLADVIFSSDTPKEVLAEINNGLRYTLGELGLFLIVPIFDDIDEANFERKDIVPSYHRLAFFLTDDEMPHRSEMVTIPKLQARLERSYFISSSGTRIAPEIVKVTWGTTYRVRFCIADQIVKTYSNGGNVILVGDAAHIHSPASGQGMNVGICDGLDAGKAIAEHIRTGDSSVLVKLDEQLKKVAMGTLLMTRMFGWVGFIHGRWGRFFRDWIMWTVGRFAPLRKKMAFRISGLAYWVK